MDEKTADGAKRESHTALQSRKLEVSVDAITKLIEELRSRVKSILREEPPQTPMNKEPEEEILVPHAAFLRTTQRKIEHSCYNLESILDRLEI